MPKVRKVHRKKTFKVNINRKKLRNKLRKLPAITCPQVKEAWEKTRSTKSNLTQMGLAYDANASIKIPSTKSEMLKKAKLLASGALVTASVGPKKKKRVAKKNSVALALEADANAPRERMFRLPSGQVQFLTSMMDKYGEDYQSMARDKKNYYQLTWKQLRAKINTFKGIPEQYAEYLVNKGEIVLDDDTQSFKDTKRKLKI
ncbi:hypothetical protein HCN44_008799 [Aphidius gifuensis]|uniref:Nucleolar protein 16 n=1 Tax=Aphidius gifuensis TaxID=684658 RepID=A0A835CPQ1_APHGI|nr:nucleolar protein 16 [Aphidius gifuensis]KAF7991487.1 hypothetical protein HCN44_008799 [Aphidius gifuensis]